MYCALTKGDINVYASVAVEEYEGRQSDILRRTVSYRDRTVDVPYLALHNPADNRYVSCRRAGFGKPAYRREYACNDASDDDS